MRNRSAIDKVMMVSARREPKPTGEPIVIYAQRPEPVEQIDDKLMELCLIVSEIRHSADKALTRDRSSPDAEILHRALMLLSWLIRASDHRSASGTWPTWSGCGRMTVHNRSQNIGRRSSN